ncbi:MAG: ATP-binding protein [Candidatus Margulisiibacteriota bacterium]
MAVSMGFVPAPQIVLQSGLFYNVVIDLLVCLACCAAAYIINARAGEKNYARFLLLLGLYWLAVAAGNLLGWFGLLAGAGYFTWLVKGLMAAPVVALLYFCFDRIFRNKLIVNALTGLAALVALYFLLETAARDGAAFNLTYWGVQWKISLEAAQIYLQWLVLPLLIAAMFLILLDALSGFKERVEPNATLYWSAVLYALVEYWQLARVTVTWQALLLRLFYLLIAFGAYLYYVDRFTPAKPRTLRRIPVFTKLIGLFVALSVIPSTVLSLLTVVSFKEIIDLYIYKPLLWNLKTSRESFLLALSNVQVQAVVLLVLTALLVVLAAVLVSRNLAESLRRLRRAMERVSRGDFSFTLRPDSNDELGDVVNYFNEMTQEIKRARDVMENWNRELEVKVRERTEDLRALFDIARAIGSSLDLELLIRRTMERIGVVNFALLNPDQTVRFAGGSTDGLRGALTVPIKAKGEVIGTLVLDAGSELAQKEALLSTIADQLAIAIENIGSYEREKEAVARLTELDRLKNEFISMVSHELRTPVTSADGYVSLFLAGVAGPISDDQRKYLTIVKENNQRLLTLINRLLDFSRIETGRFSIQRELVTIDEVITAAMESLRPQLEKRQARINLNLTTRNHSFMGDREKMAEVFINLIENALKFAPAAGAPVINITARDAGNFLEVTVADNGIGIDPLYLDKIFNKFYQIEDAMTRKVGGVGLGLALAREIIGNHHGKIWAESAGKGQGARFIFQLPVAEKA